MLKSWSAVSPGAGLSVQDIYCIFIGNNHCNPDSNTVKWDKVVSPFRLMEPDRSLIRVPASCAPYLVLLFLALGLSSPVLADSGGTNVFSAGSFDSVQPTYVPWAGVDAQNNIHCIEGKQLMVSDTGSIGPAPFAPSVGVGDLKGDGKNDLILADSYGFFWYFPNTGTPAVPAFTQAEVVPIWLGEERVEWDTEGVANYVPRIQLVDFEGTKKLDIAAGTYVGKLYRLHNVGSTEQPNFKPTQAQDRDSLLINTHKRGMLWCTYLAPFFTTAFGTNPIANVLDLVMGEGTYSANSVYLLRNTDTSANPSFNEDHLQKIIPGMGLEQLTPNVVDWNHDGKPDVIFGDRTGYLNLALNNSSDPANPTFAPNVHVKIGGVEELGHAITVTVCDLSNNHLPNLLIGRDDGTIAYAVNSGTPGNPQFNTPAMPLKGVLPPTYHYVRPTLWSKDGAFGEAYELLGVTNPQLEPGFTFPEDLKTAKYALKFWVWPYKNRFFQRYLIPQETSFTEHFINCSQGVTIKMNTRYNLHMWVMAPQNSVSSFRWDLTDGGRPDQKWVPPAQGGDIGTSSTWTEYNSSFRISNDPDPTIKEYGYGFHFSFQGQATFYIADLQIQEKQD
jgi:hypothetical protein